MSANDDHGWSPLPGNSAASHNSPPPATATGRVVGIGAICDLESMPPDRRRSQSFSVSEFVTLESGERVLLHEERGFTIGWGSLAPDPGELYDALTPEEVTEMALNTVLPDDDDSPDDHTWSWLAELARARGLAVSEEDLRQLDYEVVLTAAVRDWLSPDSSP